MPLFFVVQSLVFSYDHYLSYLCYGCNDSERYFAVMLGLVLVTGYLFSRYFQLSSEFWYTLLHLGENVYIFTTI